MEQELFCESVFEQYEMQQEPQLQERNPNLSESIQGTRVFSGKKSQQDSKAASLQKIEKSPRQTFDENRSETDRPPTWLERRRLFECDSAEIEVEKPRSVVKLQSEVLSSTTEEPPTKSVDQTQNPDSSTPEKPAHVDIEIENETEAANTTTEGEFSYIDITVPGNKLFERLQKALKEKALAEPSGQKDIAQSEKKVLPTSGEKDDSSNLMELEVHVQNPNETSVLAEETPQEGTSIPLRNTSGSKGTKDRKLKVSRKRETKRISSPSPNNESDESPAKGPQSQEQSQGKSKRKKYSLAEDVKILKYVEENCQDKTECFSKSFWENAFTVSKLLSGTRTAESLRSRYRFFLGELNEEELARVHSWGVMYGSPGYLVFKRKLVVNHDTNKQAYRNQLESIEFEELSKTFKDIPISTSNSWKPTQWRGFSDSENQLNQNLSFEQNSPKKPLQNVTQRMNVQTQSRYQREDEYLEDGKRKIVKKDAIASDTNGGGTFASKMGWLKEMAAKYEMSSPEIMELYYYCSMNPKVLELYLNGQKGLLWTKEEDKLLSESGEAGIRVLSKIRDPNDVRSRSQFLSQYANIKLLFGR